MSFFTVLVEDTVFIPWCEISKELLYIFGYCDLFQSGEDYHVVLHSIQGLAIGALISPDKVGGTCLILTNGNADNGLHMMKVIMMRFWSS